MEERLKRFKKKYILKQICECVFIFLWFYPLAFGLIDETIWFKAGIVIIVILLVSGFLTRKKAQKSHRELIGIMPMIISIKDTVESLKKERLIYNIIYVFMFAAGLTFVRSGFFSLLSCIILSLSCVFLDFANLTTQKIKYLESKPEGL